ncbi:MAG TPA: murein biosynthesis integral membrane protein MurJ [Candidatus Saccharimonadales bacterium]|nr:murein biosynthesis integral membrane protein MurJ [Candidatus Saccharimonadales bacterium]
MKGLRHGFTQLLRQQTTILSAAFMIMATVVLSQVLGLIRQRLLVSIFGASNTLGFYFYASSLPDSLFQIIISGALSSAFIPVFSQYLVKGNEKEGYKFASTLLSVSLCLFFIISVFLFIFAPQLIHYFVAPGLPDRQIGPIASLMRIILLGEMFFIIASFLSSILQCYNQFLIPGVASALYNLGIIISLLLFSKSLGIYSVSWGVVLGAFLYILLQVPFVLQKKFRFHFSLRLTKGVFDVLHLMWPRTLSIGISNIGVLVTGVLISYLASGPRNLVIFDYAKTLAFAPVALFGISIAQAAFPILSREKENKSLFQETLLTSFTQMLYIVLPFSILFLVLRIPIVRLIYGASEFDWPATVLTGRTLAFFSVSIFAQSLINLLQRGFWALHDTITPLVMVAVSTLMMIGFGAIFLFVYHFGVESIALAYSISAIVNLILLFVILDRKTGGFEKRPFIISLIKIFSASFFTAFALYIPIKLLDQLVFDTTKTVNLLILTGISSFAGLVLYMFLTWLFNVKEARSYIFLFTRVGNWKDLLKKNKESLEGTKGP